MRGRKKAKELPRSAFPICSGERNFGKMEQETRCRPAGNLEEQRNMDNAKEGHVSGVV